MGGPGYSIKANFCFWLKRPPGVLSHGTDHGATVRDSSFMEDALHLDGQYAAFMHHRGLEAQDRGGPQPVKPNGTAHEKVTVETFGEEYPAPEKCRK